MACCRGIEGLDIPATACVTRAQLSEIARSNSGLADVAAELEFPIIIRPRGSHAGVGLARVDDGAMVERYLADRPEQEFFVARFVDYASGDGLFRKYRIVFVDGRALCLPYGDRRPLGYLVPQRGHGIQRGASAAKRKASCATSTAISPSAMEARSPPSPSG